MTNLLRTNSRFRDVLDELAKSRGLSGGAEALARPVGEADPTYTPSMILEAAYGGFGPALEAALDEAGRPLDAAERARVTQGVGDEARAAWQREGAVEAMRRTAFGRVVCELAEEHGIPATLGDIGELAERSGLNRWEILDRMSGAKMDYQGPGLGGLADELGLDAGERVRLALAFAFEQEEG